MKIFKSPLVVGGVAVILAVSGVATVGVVNAVAGPQEHGTMSSLIDKIASTFNLDRNKVEKVFNDQHAEHKENHLIMIKQRLQKLVDEGTITGAQKTAIEVKLVDLKQQHETDKASYKNLNPEQRKEKMKQKRADLENWAKEQGLDLSKLSGIFSGHGLQGRGHHIMR